jgi:hypothetical protein
VRVGSLAEVFMNLFLIGWAPFGAADENRAEEVVAEAAPQRRTAPIGVSPPFPWLMGKRARAALPTLIRERSVRPVLGASVRLGGGSRRTADDRLTPYLLPTADRKMGRCARWTMRMSTGLARQWVRFHVLTALRPALAGLPFGASNPSWPTFGEMPTRRARRARRVAPRAGKALQTR